MEDSARLIRIAMLKLSQYVEIDTCCTILNFIPQLNDPLDENVLHGHVLQLRLLGSCCWYECLHPHLKSCESFIGK